MSVRPEPDLHVVGIGASAGGLEALERFFGRVPTDSGMAFVVIQHLSPDFKSLMDELLGRRTQLPIHLSEDGMRIEANHVYLIPPKKEMIVSGGRLLLSERDRQQELTMPIDIFFRSLAQDCGPRAVAIVLSGGGSDGSRGVRSVHETGGLVIVQDVASAQFEGMPKTALDAGVADFVCAPEDMPALLTDHMRRGEDRPEAPAAAIPPAGLAAVYKLLQKEFGLDFKDYKPSTVTRRIERRLALARAGDLDQYVARLQSERHELDVLYRDLLIGVTRFFRDEEAFQILADRVIPEMYERPADIPLRVWVAGCATGEEAYSIAILLHEHGLAHGHRPVKIFATDVHRGSLEFAGRAIYDEEAVSNVSSERLDRYFTRQGLGWQVVPDLRQMLVFAPHNVIEDPPFTRVDLISCRNMLIYLQPAAQQKALSLFHFALNRGGVMLLGPSESPGGLARDFVTVDAHWRMYRKANDVRIPVDSRFQPTRPVEPRGILGVVPMRYSTAQLMEAYDAVLEGCMPPSLLVNDRGELVHAFAGASHFLHKRDGRQSLDVLDMVGPELKMVFVGGFKRALQQAEPIVFTGVRLGPEAEPHRVSIRALRPRPTGPANLLVSIEPMTRPEQATVANTEIDFSRVPHEQVVALETELSYTRENLQAAIEELETSNEELQAANEELLASNEELQSTNEELQSVNEELYTVNAEYQRKIDELTELTNDVDNLLSSTEVGTIFLDSRLQVRKFTPQIAAAFNLLPQDIGRPIETFANTIDHPELLDDLRRVLETQQRIEREIRDHQGRCFFMRILPYRAKASVQGVVLTLIDTSGLKAAEDALFHERYLLDSLLRSVPDAIYFMDSRRRFIRANHAMATRCGEEEPRSLVGKTPFEVCEHNTAVSQHKYDEQVLQSGEPQLYLTVENRRDDGSVHYDMATRLPLRDRSNRVVGVIAVLRDITDGKRAEAEIRDAVRRRDQFLAMLSHELRNPLSAIVMATSLLRDGGGSPEQRTHMLRTLERQSQQMSRLLDDLLEASRVTQDKIELRRSVVDLRTIVRDAADAARGMMDNRGVNFTVEVDDRPLLVDGDPTRLQQIQVNMLSNAAKYTPRGGQVVLRADRHDAHAVIRVRDDGVGMPTEMLTRVFDLFVQSNRTLDRADGGLGLGLTLVRSLVTMHGGTVHAHSDGEGKGCEFTVRLPLAPEGAAAARSSSVMAMPRGSATVVVIEDSEDSRELLCELLRRAGLDCHGAEDGMHGLALVESTRPDVALVDLGLPGIDGFEVARRIRADGRHHGIRLIALTGYGQADDRERALQAGFDEHLVKPVQAERLTRLILDSRAQ